MPAITVKIAARGTAMSDGKPSVAGHMWFDLDSGHGNRDSLESFGWAPLERGSLNGIGKRFKDDSAKYLSTSYSRTITISQEQYNNIKTFASDPVKHGFDPTYRFMSDSCIDYVWAALHVGGLNPKKYEGHVWPTMNAERIASIPEFDVADQWRDAAADAFVNDLFKHSQALVTEFWKARLLTAPADGNKIDQEVADKWNAARNWRPMWRDPLILDLDGDGIETSGVTTILFDHDGDGIKTGTGWVSADDGFLVLDRNGNGSIDNGTELFGDATALHGGGRAADGFAALTQEDSNHDGKVDQLDASWHQLRVWRDVNQDGISQTEELLTLSQLGIASISTAKTRHGWLLGNGNQLAERGTYTRTGGVVGIPGEVRQMADVNLAENAFHREFTDEVALTDGVAELPDMRGSGRVRDLRQATSLSPALHTVLVQYSQATTRQAQQALLDQLLGAWADTSGMAGTMEQRANGEYAIVYQAFGNQTMPVADAAGKTVVDPDWAGVVAAWKKKLHVLEAFNGRYFFDLSNVMQSLLSNVNGLRWDKDSLVRRQLNVSFSTEQINLLNQSYAALRQSIYASLIMQTRFQSVTDKLGLIFDINAIRANHAPIERYFDHAIAQDAVRGMGDLIEFNRYANRNAVAIASGSWNGMALMEARMRSLVLTPALQSLYAELGVTIIVGDVAGNPYDGSAGHDIVVAGDAADCVHGRGGDDVILGGAGNDVLHGDAGDDVLSGGDQDDQLHGGDGADVLRGENGNDWLTGNAGDDVLDGGPGNDMLHGGNGDDTYLFGIGSGQDTISSYENRAGKCDAIQLGEGIGSADILLRRDGSALVLSLKGHRDRLRVEAYFYGDASYGYQIEQIRFADGSVWDVARIRQAVATGSDGDDALHGDAAANILHGLAGNDMLDGKAGDDVLDGGTGADRLHGGTGEDTLCGGSGNDELYGDAGADCLQGQDGNDRLYGGTGDDTLDGGAGNDTLNGGAGDDTYLFGIGSGQDVIASHESRAGKHDVIQMGEGIGVADIVLRRQWQSLVLSIRGHADSLRVDGYFYSDASHGCQVEQIRFADGASLDVAAIKQLVTTGTAGNDALYGFAGADNVRGLAGDDVLNGKGGNDVLDGGAGADHLYGDAGNNILDGGAGNDILRGGSGNEIFIGGTGNDSITAGIGADLIVFNRGDGQDRVFADTGKDNTLSLGNGIRYADLRLTKNANDLTLVTGTHEHITFKDWYRDINHHSVATLQMIIEDSADYDATSVNAISNTKVTQFNFTGLVSAFDQARTETATLKHWAMSSALADHYLDGSDVAAIGGELAYQYARKGSWSSMSSTQMHALLADARFGLVSQCWRSAGPIPNASCGLT